MSPSLCHYQSDEDEPDVDSDFDDGGFSVSDGSNRSNRNKKKPKSAKKKKKGWHGNNTRIEKSVLLSAHQIKHLRTDSGLMLGDSPC